MKIPFLVLALTLATTLVLTASHARLGETLAQLKKRFGTSVREVEPGHKDDSALLFTTSSMTVNVGLVKGRSARELYYSRKPLVNGHAPDDIVMGIATANTGQAAWKKVRNFDEVDHGYEMETLDGRYLLRVILGADSKRKEIPTTFTVAVFDNVALNALNR